MVRPADDYKVGDIVAYRSTMLHVVVLHRIIAIKGDRYVFKGDNNDFVDPDAARPRRCGRQAVGARRRTAAASSPGCTPPSWPRCSSAAWPRSCSWAPSSSAAAATAAGRPRRAPAARSRPAAAARGSSALDAQTVFTASAVAAVAFLALGALALTRPATKPVAMKTPYTEKVSFGYHAKAPAGPVYPDGVVKTGDPIFLKLVHRVRVKAHYRLAATAPQRLGGTMEVLLRLTSPTGWTRTIQLAAPKRFTGDYAGADVILDVPAVAVADPQGREADRRRRGRCLQPRPSCRGST